MEQSAYFLMQRASIRPEYGRTLHRGWWIVFSLAASVLVPPLAMVVWRCLFRDKPDPELGPSSISKAEVEQQERLYIKERQASVGHSNDKTVGLALSGGGIRSAAFSLGVLHCLESTGLLKKVDYLSSVSGGGYAAGAFLYGSDLGESRAAKVRDRLLDSEGYIEFGLTSTILMISAMLVSAFFCTSPIFFALFAMCRMTDLASGSSWFGIVIETILTVVGCVGMLWISRKKNRRNDQHLWMVLSVFFGGILLQILENKFSVQYGRWWFACIICAASILGWVLARLPSHRGVRRSQQYAKILLLPVLGLVGIAFAKPLLGSNVMYFLALFGIVFFMSKASNPNWWNFSFRFYSANLSSAFLSGVADKPICRATTFEGAPLHIINCFHQGTNSDDPATRDRGGCNFSISRFHCGSRETGFFATRSWLAGGRADHQHLGKLMATSGAAVDGHLRRQSPLLNAILSIGNVGLGQWAINPSVKWHLRHGAPTSSYNFFSALGGQVVKATWSRLSDGGHFENLGLYELVGRRCGHIIVADAGYDPAFRFVDLANAAARCYEDWGAEIELPIQNDVGNESKNSVYEGVVRYKDGKLARLTYLKLSVGPQHSLRLRIRTALDKRFPHQPTREQQVDRAFINAYFDLGMQTAQLANLH